MKMKMNTYFKVNNFYKFSDKYNEQFYYLKVTAVRDDSIGICIFYDCTTYSVRLVKYDLIDEIYNVEHLDMDETQFRLLVS